MEGCQSIQSDRHYHIALFITPVFVMPKARKFRTELTITLLPVLPLAGWQFYPNARLEQCRLRTLLGTEAIFRIAGVTLDGTRHGEAEQTHQRMALCSAPRSWALTSRHLPVVTLPLSSTRWSRTGCPSCPSSSRMPSATFRCLRSRRRFSSLRLKRSS